MTEDLTMFRDDHGYVIARDPMDAARLRAEAFAGDPDFATERDAAGFEPVKVRAVIGVREDEHAPVVEKFAGEGSGVIHPESHHPAGTAAKSYHPKYAGRWPTPAQRFSRGPRSGAPALRRVVAAS